MKTPCNAISARNQKTNSLHIAHFHQIDKQLSSIFNPLKFLTQMLSPRVRSSKPELKFSLPFPNLLLRAAIEPQSSSSSFSSTLIWGLFFRMPLITPGLLAPPLAACSVIDVPFETASEWLVTGRYRAERPIFERSEGAIEGVYPGLGPIPIPKVEYGRWLCPFVDTKDMGRF